MAFDHENATPEQLEARRQKFVRQAPKIKDAVLYTKILNTFPLDMQDSVKADIEPLLTYPR